MRIATANPENERRVALKLSRSDTENPNFEAVKQL
jgi:hypothetical protein